MSAFSCSAARAVVAPKAVAKRGDARSAKAARAPSSVALAAPAFAAASLASTPAAHAASEAISQTADGVGLAVGGVAAVAAASSWRRIPRSAATT